MKNRILEVLSVRSFSLLIVAEFFSQIAMNVLNFALVIIVFTVANSNTAVSGVVLAFTLPAIFFGILAGIYVDKWNKKKVLVVTNALRALIVFPLAFFYHSLFLIYVLTFLSSIVAQFFLPAETPIIPLLVRRDLLLSANAVFGVIIYISIFIAYALSGPLLVLVGKTNIFILLAIFFLLASFFASLVQIKKEEGAKDFLKASDLLDFDLKREIKTALSIVAKTRTVIYALFLLALAQVLFLVLAVIGPGYARQILNINVEQFPLLFVTPAIIGVAIGAYFIGAVFNNKSKDVMTRVGLILYSLCLLALPYGSKVASRDFVHALNYYLPHFLTINILHIMIITVFIMGIANALVIVPANTMLQEQISDQSRGKVYGILSTIVGIGSILPIFIAGGTADIFGVGRVITGIGIAVFLIALLVILFNRK